MNNIVSVVVVGQLCASDHVASIDDCEQAFIDNTRSGCDGKCHALEATIRSQCIANASMLSDGRMAECGGALL